MAFCRDEGGSEASTDEAGRDLARRMSLLFFAMWLRLLAIALAVLGRWRDGVLGFDRDGIRVVLRG